MESTDGAAMPVAPGSGHIVWLPLPESAVGAFVARYIHPPEAVAPDIDGVLAS
jgi:putative protease